MKNSLWIGVFSLMIPSLYAAGAAAADTVEMFSGGLPKLTGSHPRLDTGVDPAKEPFVVHVPPNYTGSQPFGLIVFIPASGSAVSAPAGWDKVLEEKRLLLVIPQRAINSMAVPLRLGLGVIAALKMKEKFKA